jgi:hypothetical protein
MMEEYQEQMERLISEITKLTNSCLPDKGLTFEQSQKVGILNAIKTLDRRINGLEEADFRDDDEELEKARIKKRQLNWL